MDGTLAVRHGDRYLRVEECAAAEKKSPPAKPQVARRTQPRSSNWDETFRPEEKGRRSGKRRKHPGVVRRTPSHELNPGGVARGRKFALYREILRAKPIARLGVFATIPLRHSIPAAFDTEAPQYAFFRHGGIYPSDVAETKPRGGNRLPPEGRPRAQVKERAGRNMLIIVRDEFRPAIPRSGWSPPEPASALPAHAA
jgi:hypothetical protein